MKILIFILAIIFLTIGNSQAEDKYEGKISGLEPYTAAGGFSKTIIKYSSRLRELERFRRMMAEMIIDSGKCEIVSYVDISDRGSLHSMKFFADCENGKRIRMSENEITKKEIVLTESEKSWDEKTVWEICKDYVKSSIKFHNGNIHHSTGIHKFPSFEGSGVYKAPTTHNVVAIVDLDITDVHDNKIKYKYTVKCFFQPGESPIIETYRNDNGTLIRF